MALIFNYIKDFFVFIFQIVSSVISWLYNLITLIISGVGFVLRFFGALPTFFTVSVVALTAVCLIYKILGRESQS